MGLQNVTEDRVDLLKEQIVSLLEQRLGENIDKISQGVYENDDGEIAYFSSIVKELYEKVIDAQKRGKFGKLQTIFISYLRAAALNGELELQLRAMDEEGYGGQEIIDVSWVPTFATEYFRSDLAYMIPGLRNRIFRLTTREESLAKMMYASDYYKIVLKYLMVFIDVFQYNPLFEQVDAQEEVSIVFGEMCDQGTEIYSFLSSEE